MQFTMLHKLGFAAVITAWIIGGVNLIGNILIPAEPMHKSESSAVKPAEKAAQKPAPAKKAAENTTETAAAPVATPGGVMTMLAAAANAGAGAGKKVFKKCKACHTADKGGKNRVGPNLWDVVGRAKAGSKGYRYSGALKGLGGEWTYQDLDGFLANPKSFAKGTKMGFAGVKKAGDRAALIVFLRSLSDQPKPLP